MYDEPKAGMDELSRRDLFAMAALQGILAGPTLIKAHDLAKQSYRIADAMIWEGNAKTDAMGCPIDPPDDPTDFAHEGREHVAE